MKLNKYILLIGILLMVPNACSGQSRDVAHPIDKEIVRHIDLTGDGQDETVTLRVQGKSLYSPFSWTLTIQSKGKQMLKFDGDGAWFDKFFNDENYVGGCKGYAECKEKFFFHDILDRLVVPPSGYSVEGILNKSASNTLYAIGGAYLEKCCGIRGKEADTILSGMAARLRSGKAIVINTFTSPETVDPPMIFAPEIDRFVPIYED